MTSCFISYTAADSAWAEWVADILRKAGHRVIVQATEFLPGDNFVLRMQEAASNCEHTIVILSNQFFMSRFGAAEWAAAFARDPTGKERRLIPIAVDDVQPTGLWSAIVRLNICGMSEDVAGEEVLRALPPLQKPSPSFPGSRRKINGPGPIDGPRVDVWRLSASSANMIGRGTETELLTRSWLSGRENIIAVGGWGGAGKTTLVSNWLAEMATYKYHGAESVFAWSFDRQPDGEQWATSDQFFDTLIRFLGIEGSGSTTTWERCREATTQLQRSRSLIILDGLERVQQPPGPLEGKFRERVMQMFFRELAALNGGLVVVTSRLPIIDIDSYFGKTCLLVPIQELTRSESIGVLRSRGVRGETAELSNIADEVRDHPLSLQLLSGYLQTVFDGDARLWKQSGLARAVANDGGNTSAIMDQYVAWFAERPELQALQMMSLFNREVATDELACLRAAPVCNGLNDLVSGMSRTKFAYCLAALRRAGLVRASSSGEAMDVHPLVREHFQRHFRDVSPNAYREGHRRLRDFLSTRSAGLPQTLDECSPVIAAIWHGTRAGENISAFEELYLPKLSQHNHFLRDSLGAAASNYAALTYIIEDTGGVALSPGQLAQILADQSLDLRMLGNTTEAVFPLTSAIEIARGQSEPSILVNMLRHLSQLELAIGNVDEACSHAEEAVRISESPGSRPLEIISAKTSYAHALLQAGRYGECVASLKDCGLFTADSGDKALTAHCDRLTFYIAVYRAGDALLTIQGLNESRRGPSLATSDLMSLLERLKGNVEISLARLAQSQHHPGQLALSMVDLLAARIESAYLQSEKSGSASLLEAAVEEIRKIGQRPWIIEANLVKSRAMRRSGALVAATKSLTVAENVAAADRMIAQVLVCRLERAKLEMEAGRMLDREELEEIASQAARSGLMLIAHLAEDVGAADDR